MATAFSSEPISVAEIFDTLRKRWLLSTGVVLTCVAAAVGLAAFMDRVYRAEVVVSPVSEGSTSSALAGLAGQFGGLASLAGVSLGTSTDTAVNVATLRSRSLLESFIENRNLLPVLFADEWDSAARKWTSDDPSGVPTVNDGIELMQRHVSDVFEDKETGLVTVSIEWKDRQLAADWANSLVDLANAKLRSQTIGDARSGIEYLQKELERTDVVSVRDVIHRQIESDVRRIIVANVNPEFAFKVIDPAKPPDADDYVQPNWPLMLLIGLALGIAAALALAVWGLTSSEPRGT